MKVMLSVALLSLSIGTAFAQAPDVFDSKVPVNGTLPSGEILRVPTAVLFTAGPLSDQTNGTPPVPISVLNGAAPFNYNTLGFSVTTAVRLTDDFTVPAGQTWSVDAVTVYGYQSGATAVTLNAATLQVWNAVPTVGGTPIFGNTTTNRLGTAGQSGAFRVSNTTLTDRTRSLQAARITLSPPLTLTAGTYWLDWNLAGTGALGPFSSPVVPTLAAPAPTGNARQLVVAGGTAYNPLNIGLVGDPAGGPLTGPVQGLPFVVEGTNVVAQAPAVPVPTTSLWGKLGLGLLLASLALVALRRRA
jgi:hypothetical protein